MMIIARLYPKMDLNKVWNYVENEIAKESTNLVTPLYATQTEGMMSVGVILMLKTWTISLIFLQKMLPNVMMFTIPKLYRL